MATRALCPLQAIVASLSGLENQHAAQRTHLMEHIGKAATLQGMHHDSTK